MNNSISELTNLWDRVLVRIEKELDEKQVYDYFFANSYINEVSGNTLIIVVTSPVAVNVIKSNYHDIVYEIVNDLTDANYKLEFITADQAKQPISQESSSSPSSERKYFKDSFLDPNQTFDTFVVGDFNREASQASLFVAANPGVMFNPLFIHSNSGLGKTHLMHAIGNYVQKDYALKGKAPAKVLYITANNFVEEYVKFVKGEKDSEFLKDFVSSFDILLLDDVQFLENKVKTEEMFFYIYENLINLKKQVVITSDRQPNELKGLEDRLVTRFTKGLVVKINDPDQQTCVEILKKKISARGIDLSMFDDSVLYFLADRFSRDVRELEGALMRLTFYAINFKQTNHITLDVAIEAVQDLIGGKSLASAMNEQRIINIVADYYNLTPSQVVGKDRSGEIIIARHVAMWLIRNTIDVPLKKIGDAFGGKDHTTVMNAISKVDNELKTNESLKDAIEELKRRLKS